MASLLDFRIADTMLTGTIPSELSGLDNVEQFRLLDSGMSSRVQSPNFLQRHTHDLFCFFYRHIRDDTFRIRNAIIII